VILQKEGIITQTYVWRVWRKIEHLPVPVLQLVLDDLFHMIWVLSMQQDRLEGQ
jgi:hypothetical protein